MPLHMLVTHLSQQHPGALTEDARVGSRLGSWVWTRAWRKTVALVRRDQALSCVR